MKRQEAIKMFGDYAWDDSDFTQKEVGNCPWFKQKIVISWFKIITMMIAD